MLWFYCFILLYCVYFFESISSRELVERRHKRNKKKTGKSDFFISHTWEILFMYRTKNNYFLHLFNEFFGCFSWTLLNVWKAFLHGETNYFTLFFAGWWEEVRWLWRNLLHKDFETVLKLQKTSSIKDWGDETLLGYRQKIFGLQS